MFGKAPVTQAWAHRDWDVGAITNKSEVKLTYYQYNKLSYLTTV